MSLPGDAKRHSSPSGEDLFFNYWRLFEAQSRASAEWIEQISNPKPAQRLWLDLCSQMCDEYLRSGPFLEFMRQHMKAITDAKLFFDQRIRENLSRAGLPSSDDLGEVLKALQRLEGAQTQRLEAIEGRLARLESKVSKEQ